MKPSDLSPGDRVTVDAADIGSFVMTFDGWAKDGSGGSVMLFDAPAPTFGLRLHPPAFRNGVAVGTYSRA